MKLRTLQDSPEYSQATKKLASLQAARDELEQKIQDALNTLSTHRATAATDRRTARAEALLEGKSLSQLSEDDLRETYSKTVEERRVVEDAITIQKRNIDQIARGLATQFSKSARKEYEGFVTKHYEAVRAAVESAEKIRLFLDDLHERGLLDSTVLPVVLFGGLGRPPAIENYGPLAWFVRNALDAGIQVDDPALAAR